MANIIRIGVIGASASGGWARESHVPAILRSDGLELAAVATNSRKTANAAAAAFGVLKAYGSGLDLIADPMIDVVTVATRVPDHRELVLAAVAAGKDVYSEWPLGRGSGEAYELANAAQRAGVRTAIGLQLRASPAVRQARALIDAGAIGRILGVNVQSATAGFGERVPDAFAYLEEPVNFANLVTIQAAHTLDLSIAIAGALDSASALATRQYPRIKIGENEEIRDRTTFDHILVQGELANGGTLAVEVSGGRPPETPFRMEVTGETGTLVLHGGAPRGVQSSRLTLSLNGERQVIEEGPLSTLQDSALNVARVYASMRDDKLHGTTTTKGFDHAVALTKMIEDQLDSSRVGHRKMAIGWPAS